MHKPYLLDRGLDFCDLDRSQAEFCRLSFGRGRDSMAGIRKMTDAVAGAVAGAVADSDVDAAADAAQDGWMSVVKWDAGARW